MAQNIQKQFKEKLILITIFERNISNGSKKFERNNSNGSNKNSKGKNFERFQATDEFHIRKKYYD